MIHGFSPAELIGVTSILFHPSLFYFRSARYGVIITGVRKRQAITGIVLGTVILTVLMSLLNLWILTLYIWQFGTTVNFARISISSLIGVLPFNLIKGLDLFTIVYTIIAGRLRSWLDQHRMI